VRISVYGSLEGPISESGGVGVRWGLAGRNLMGVPPIEAGLKAHPMCYLCPWPKFGLVSFVQPKEQGPFAGCCAYQSLDFPIAVL